VGGDHILASHDGKPVTREVFAILVKEIKEDCSGMSSLLIFFIKQFVELVYCYSSCVEIAVINFL
jgi:hypothetical protein